jgi:uncharacterized delta-60 repeat protein
MAKMFVRFNITAAVLASALVFAVIPALAGPATLDASFSGDGKVTTNFTAGFDGAKAVAIQVDGKIVAVGGAGSSRRFALARYNVDGSRDTTFGGDGKVTTNFTRHSDVATGVAIQADGKIVAVGEVSRNTSNGTVGRFALARYNDDGTLDTTFDGDGKVTTDFTAGKDGAMAVAIQGDGQILAAGSANTFCFCSRFALARYNDDGTLDTTFGGDGKVTTTFKGGSAANAAAIQANGKIVAVGGQVPEVDKFEVARYHSDGTLDTTFNGDGKVSTNMGQGEESATDVAIQANGKVVVAGYTDVPH